MNLLNQITKPNKRRPMQMHAMWLQAASPIWTLQSTSNGTDVIANLVFFFFFLNLKFCAQNLIRLSCVHTMEHASFSKSTARKTNSIPKIMWTNIVWINTCIHFLTKTIFLQKQSKKQALNCQ